MPAETLLQDYAGACLRRREPIPFNKNSEIFEGVREERPNLEGLTTKYRL